MSFTEYQRMTKRHERKLEYLTPGSDVVADLLDRFNSYKHHDLIISGAPLSCVISVDKLNVCGYPYPCLLCQPSDRAGNIMINLLEKIAYEQYGRQKMIVIIKGKVIERFGFECTLKCYN